MSKDQYTIRDDPTMKPKTVDILVKLIGRHYAQSYPNEKVPSGSTKEYVDYFVNTQKALEGRVESVEYWYNVKADK